MIDFDWITPALALAQTAINGPGAQFNVTSPVGIYEVADILRSNRIRYWSMLRLDSGDIAFRVAAGDGRRCGLVLAQDGVAYVADWGRCGRKSSGLWTKVKGWW